MLIVNVHTAKLPDCDLQRTDPASRQRGRPQRQDNKFQTQTLEKEAISGQMSTKWARHQDILTD
jgi:hypothetical protein